MKFLNFFVLIAFTFFGLVKHFSGFSIKQLYRRKRGRDQWRRLLGRASASESLSPRSRSNQRGQTGAGTPQGSSAGCSSYNLYVKRIATELQTEIEQVTPELIATNPVTNVKESIADTWFIDDLG